MKFQYTTTLSTNTEGEITKRPLIELELIGKTETLTVLVVEVAVGIKEEESALALVPVLDVLADQGFEKFRLTSAGRSTRIQMFVSCGAGENQSGVSAGKQSQVEVVAGGVGAWFIREAHQVLRRCSGSAWHNPTPSLQS